MYGFIPNFISFPMQPLLTYLHDYMAARDRLGNRPSDVAKSIIIEAAELLEVFQWDSLEVEETKRQAYKMDKVREELADVLIYCFEMAILLGLDPETLVREKLEKAGKKYPAEVVRALEKLPPEEREQAYRKIREEYRVRQYTGGQE